MPKFLEDKLKREYGQNSAVPFKVMNKIGAMRGNKETEKGRELEQKHQEDTMKKPGMKMSASPMREMRIEIHRGPKQEVTGFTVHHHMMPQSQGKSGAFMENTEHEYPFGADGQSTTHGYMGDHVDEHLSAQMGKAAPISKGDGEMEEAEGE